LLLAMVGVVILLLLVIEDEFICARTG
jgi:hypothetical protein